MKPTYFFGLLAIALGFQTTCLAKEADALSARVKIGANLEGIADWSRSNVFADLVKQSRGFGPPDKPWTGSVPLDSHGWPATDFGIILGSWEGEKALGGTYKISFKCSATPTITPISSPGIVKNVARDSSTGIVTADLVYPDMGPQLMLKFTHTEGGVKNLKILRPGYHSNETFTRPFLRHAAKFSSLRFMDYQSTNGSPVKHWSERTLPSSPSYSGANGHQVPWEVCIKLCNELHEDAWINIPHEADDDYVRSLAKLFRSKLDPDLHVYLEYSNEVWNWGFAQATWNKNQAAADVAAGDPDLNFDHVNDPNVFSARRIAKRIKTISDIFKKQYGEEGFAKCVRPVLAAQIAWPAYWLVDELTFLNDRFGPPKSYLYACSGAPYFNLGDADKNPKLSKDDVLRALRANVALFKTDLNIDACATLARYYDLKFVGYEGGPDTFGPNNIQAKKAAALDPEMQKICAEYLRAWYGYGFDLLNWFVAGATNYDTQYGTWGLTDDMTNLASPKIKAIDEVRAERFEPITAGIAVPGTVDPRKFAFRDAKWLTADPLVLSPSDWRGPSRDYLLRVNTDGQHRLELSVGTEHGGAKLEAWLNNTLMGSVSLPDTGGLNSPRTALPLALAMHPGINVLRLKIVSGTHAKISAIAIR